MAIETARKSSQHPVPTWRLSPRSALHRLLNRDLASGWRIELRSVWPLLFLPVLLFMQALGPSPIWTALLVSLVALYGISFGWVRKQASKIRIERRREGAMLVVGDAMQERFAVYNESSLPLHWLEFADRSRLPGYNPRQVVSCGPGGSYQWRAEAQCSRRGVFRLGPHTLRTGDPFGLFSLEATEAHYETLLVYPRVAHIPTLALPRGNLSGRDRHRRAYAGTERASVVRAYHAGDSLRHVHWPTSARQGELMVTDVETEPSGDLWIILDVNRQAQSGIAQTSTLETAIVLAASAAAEYLGGGERRSVGLLTAPSPDTFERSSAEENEAYEDFSMQEDGVEETRVSPVVDVPPLPGKGQTWRILAALAPVQEGDLPLGQLLQRSRGLFNAGQTILVITSDIGEGVPDWAAELLHLRRGGVASSVLAVTPAAGTAPTSIAEDEAGNEPTQPIFDSEPTSLPDSAQGAAQESVEGDVEHRSGSLEILARYEIPVQFLQAGTRLAPAMTYRRRRTVLRTTPSGGVVAYEIEEDVG